ncbi:hypothetical protein PHLCEN_2v11225 [Hermanssonia centrifuga]|uniref:BHLH domain-containing protein n=1 Tax=Hermanssonia centrifuga TaxID=98765 RepID=A0A2R6NLN3_9APHY|nr:hypothetical protein PHLCEN_2v11225 [Hermanssonia centrifuga]
MDRSPASQPSAKPGESGSNGPQANAQNKPSSPAITSRSPVTPLAPLEFLQNQRRGSITDPSLHAAGPSGLVHLNTSALNSSKSPSSRPPETSPPGTQQQSPPYRFGEASSHPSEAVSPSLIRRLLRSPSAETASPVATDRGQEQSRSPTARESNGEQDSERMDVDAQNLQQPSRPDFDFNSRRPSLAGTKRKKSSEHDSPSAGEIDPQLMGPGVPSAMSIDEGPAPKRRGSTFDTQRLEQLHLGDRRNSVDSRAGTVPNNGGANAQWWGNERRESVTPVFANTPLSAGGYGPSNSVFSGDSPHGRPPPGGIGTFAWPTSNPPADQAQQAGPQHSSNEANMANNPGPYDPNLAAMIPPVSFAQDRRMSAPAISPENMSTPPASGPTRALRSRSRPPSRVRAGNQSAGTNAEQSPGPSNNSSIPEDATGSPSQTPTLREAGSTPYSRSPELRVSHKLAERKRRKEMKDLFDELRDQLPADRGMKASKWEILSKAIDFIVNLKQSHQDMSREIEMLRHELDSIRQGIPPFPPGGPPHPVVYGHGPPPVGVPPFPPPPGPGGPPPPPHHAQPPQPPPQPLSRPGSAQNMYPPGPGPVGPPNGAANPMAVPRTDNAS